MLTSFKIFNKSLDTLPEGKLVVNTINAHSYNLTRQDKEFAKALHNSHVLLPDGISIVYAKRILDGERIEKIAGFDFFQYSMTRLQKRGAGKVFFLGSSNNVLQLIKEKALKDFPELEIHTYSPSYKPKFSKEESNQMIEAVNNIQPDVLFVGMTAPKQEKWVDEHYEKLQCGHIGSIGAVFDFYAGTINRAPKWWIDNGLEWLYRLLKEPKRMARRYVWGNAKFIYYVIKEKIF